MRCVRGRDPFFLSVWLHGDSCHALLDPKISMCLVKPRCGVGDG